MQKNRFLSVLAGIIIGFIVGALFYITTARCLITGPMTELDGMFIPTELNNAILLIGLKWGGLAGGIVGFIGGLGTPFEVPRGHMSMGISSLSFFVCNILAFIMYGRNLADMSAGRIAVTFGWVLLLFLMTLPIGKTMSFFEKIRE